MEKLTIINTTAENLHKFGMCGYKNIKNEGYRQKIEWTKINFEHGLKYKMLVSESKGAVGGIEYLPGEDAWRPVEAKGYMFIHCVYIMKKDAKGQGYGQKLVEACIDDTKAAGMNGVVVVVRKGSWMAGKDLFIKMGFQQADFAKPDFELLVYKFNADAPNPAFVHGWDEKLKKYTEGLFIFTSGQCPYAWKTTTEIFDAAKKDYNITPKIIELKNSIEAREVPFPFGTFGIILNGKVVADHPVSQTRFRNIMKKELAK